LTGPLSCQPLQLVEAESRRGQRNRVTRFHLHLPQAALEQQKPSAPCPARPASVGGMDRHIPDAWPPNTVTVAGAAGKAHQLRQAWIVRQSPTAASCCSSALRTGGAGRRLPTDGIARSLSSSEQIKSPSPGLRRAECFGLGVGRPGTGEAVGTGQEVRWKSNLRRGAANANGNDPCPILARRCRLEGQPTLKGCQHATPADPLLILLHGWLLLSASFWLPCLEELAHRWRVEAPDLPGFGQRPRPRGCSQGPGQLRPLGGQHSLEQAGNRPISVLVGHSTRWQLALHAAQPARDHLPWVIQIGVGGRGSIQPRAFARLRQGGAACFALPARPAGGWPGPPRCRQSPDR